MHEFTEFLSGRFRKFHDLSDDFGMVRGNVLALGLVLDCVVENWFFKVGEGLVFVPEGQLIFASRKM